MSQLLKPKSYKIYLRFVLLWIRKVSSGNIHMFKQSIKKALIWYCSFEFLFFCRWNYLHGYINKHIPTTIINTESINTDHKYMERILNLSHKYSKLHKNGCKGWLLEWFNGCDITEIHKQNLIEFLWWSLFVNRNECENTLKVAEIEWRKNFIDKAYNLIEDELKYKLPNGYNDKISFIANTKNGPIQSLYHPLIIYIVLYITQKISDFCYYFILKFQYEWINGLKVWYYIPENVKDIKNKKPILLIHGLGIGLFPYARFIRSILAKNRNQIIICIEMPWITVSIKNYMFGGLSYIKHRLPSKTSDFIDIMKNMQYKIGNSVTWSDWTLIGHSYGSFIVSGIYKHIKCRENVNNNNVPRLILIDPVCLCVSHPTTVSLVECVASDWSTYMLQLFMVKELQISCTLSRYMHWFQYVLYPDDLINDNTINHVVCIGTRDTIIPFEIINQGIININKKCAYRNKINKIVFENKGHAKWLSSKKYIGKVVELLYKCNH